MQLGTRREGNLFPSIGASSSKVEACVCLRLNPTYSCSFHRTPAKETASDVATCDGESFADIDLSCSGHEWHGRMHAGESNQKLKLQKRRHSVWIFPKQRCCVRVWGGGRDESDREEGDQLCLFKGLQSCLTPSPSGC